MLPRHSGAVLGDSNALPPSLISAIQAGQVDLNDSAVTIQLLKLNAVVGVIGRVAPNNKLVTVGITCALCHSTVDNSVAPGNRQTAWRPPNTRLNVGAIIALSPASPDKFTFQSWGPGKYDPRLHACNGTTFIPLNSPTHDGSPPDLLSVVNHYNTLFNLGLTNQQKADLVAFLKTL